MSNLVHGGDLADFGRRNPDAPRPLIDLSTGINPVPYQPILNELDMARLPGQTDYDACIGAFASYVGADPACVQVTPGSQSIISGLPTLFEPCRVAILTPTYGEHERSWQRAGHQVMSVAASQLTDIDADIIVLTNPNNPDGHVFSRDLLLAMQKRQADKNRWLIVDEAFVDVVPECSVADRVSEGGLIVLRSFGKFFGLAGIRLGFLISPSLIGERFSNLSGPWNVATEALSIGAQAYSDETWITSTRQRLGQDAARLCVLMAGKVESAVGGTSLFHLFASGEADDLAAYLATCGIFVRSFPEEPRWLRLGLPGNEPDWLRLHDALESWER